MITHKLGVTRYFVGLLFLGAALVVGCSDAPEPSRGGGGKQPRIMSYADAEKGLAALRASVYAAEVPVGQVELIATGTASIEDTLPDIATFPMVVDPVADNQSVVAEIFASTEKSGSGTDGWMVEVATHFNEANYRTSSGKLARIAVRKIASGTAYEFIASRKYIPDAFSPSNDLWIEMARDQGARITPITERLAGNVAGLVMKTAVADRLKAGTAQISVSDLVNAAIQGKVVVGYTNPFASSTGLNFLVTVLQTFAKGDESAMLTPDVASAFENFQKSVPFVALTTMQMRDSVEKDRSLEAFVLEYQTFVQTPSLKSGYVFIPFGFRHDNPLCAVGQVRSEKKEVLDLFAKFAQGPQAQKLATDYGFNPKLDWKAPFKLPSGKTLIEAQKLWKQKKDAGRPIAALFLADVSGSMGGSKIQQLRQALTEGGSFISPQNAIGLASFASNVSILLPIRPFQLVQQSAFQTAVRHLDAEGNTAMYDGIVVALSMLVDYKKANPEVRPMVFVLTDGQTNRGLIFEDVAEVIAGMRIPIYTIGFEADIKELGRLSSLVEAASLNASEADLRYKIGALLNSQM
jgi:Ca-activated chloride channel family protein